MALPLIKVENLSKKFLISHEKQEPYTTLRDVMAKSVKKLFQKGVKPEGNSEEFWALRDLNFEIKQGDRVGIIGRNGAGKSTLLKILSRISEPSSGKISIRGRVASLLEVGTGFHPELTGRENVFLNGAILGMGRAEINKKFDEIVSFAEVERFLDTPVKRYSSGMYVRLAFAVAAHLEPEILIVDEVLAVGDTQFQKKCIGKMEDVSKNEGRTVLFVSHNMNVIKNICKSGIVLSQGKLVFSGGANEAVEKYLEGSADLGTVAKLYSHKVKCEFAKIVNININNSKNPLVTIFEKLTIDLEIEVLQNISQVEFFVLIYNIEGSPITGLFQKDNDELFKIDSTNHKVSVTLENNLVPGKYFVSAGMFDRSRQFVDWVEFGEMFEIEHAYADGRLFEPRLGATLQKVQWEKIR
ncbi:ABC transporter [Niastella vici]|uniref:ABC transporter n=1 Tax=Niastella vici TaxID=1703345 RepID=A0A1V9G8N2_9BACT|nr:ABC transporter ATP-binding protein [Niastella vici]OQP66904.1 ABC transporter [Niastella vici]